MVSGHYASPSICLTVNMPHLKPICLNLNQYASKGLLYGAITWSIWIKNMYIPYYMVYESGCKFMPVFIHEYE